MKDEMKLKDQPVRELTMFAGISRDGKYSSDENNRAVGGLAG